MAKKGRGGRKPTRPQIRNANMLKGQKPEIVKEEGKAQFVKTVQKEKAEGKTMQAITQAKVKEIIAEKEKNIPKQDKGIQSKIKQIIAQKSTPSVKIAVEKSKSQLKAAKAPPVEKPVKNDRILRLKAATSISSPDMADRQKLQQEMKKKQPAKNPTPTKKPPTPGR